MDVYWLEQVEADVPAENDWLSATEAVRLNGMRFAKRRADWRLGRWTAKRALGACFEVPSHPRALRDIEIRPAPSGAPEVVFADKPIAVSISLSHRAGVAACVVAPSKAALGCDLETIEPRSDAFVADYFTAEEQELVARASAAERSRLIALLWSGKESALKALRAGLRLDTRCVSVSPGDAPPRRGDHEEGRREHTLLHSGASHGLNMWRPLQVRYTNGHIFHGWWQHRGNLTETLVADPPPVPPILLRVSKYLAGQSSVSIVSEQTRS